MYNIFPSCLSWVLVEHAGTLYFEQMTWGFRPFWAPLSYAKANAMSEYLFDSKMFKASARRKRCLAIASGFYEPQGEIDPKPQYCFRYKDFRLMALAGIWTQYDGDDGQYNNFSIVTTQANSLVAPIHHRMPVVMDDNWDAWLDSSYSDEAAIQAMLAPVDYPDMITYRTNDCVRFVKNQGPECVEPFK